MARTLSRPLFSTTAAIVPSGRKWQLRRFPSPNLPFRFRPISANGQPIGQSLDRTFATAWRRLLRAHCCCSDERHRFSKDGVSRRLRR